MLSMLLWCLWLLSQPPSYSVFGSINVALLPHMAANRCPLHPIVRPRVTPYPQPRRDCWCWSWPARTRLCMARSSLHQGMHMWLTIAVDNNAESNGVNEWSPLTLLELLFTAAKMTQFWARFKQNDLQNCAIREILAKSYRIAPQNRAELVPKLLLRIPLYMDFSILIPLCSMIMSIHCFIDIFVGPLNTNCIKGKLTKCGHLEVKTFHLASLILSL